MFRRLLNVAVLLVGGVPLAWTLLARVLDLRRSVGVAVLLGIGLLLNVVGMSRRTLELRAWLRLLALLVGLAVLAAAVLVRHAMIDTLAGVSPDNVAVHAALSRAAASTAWLGAALLYVLVSLALLPPNPAASGVRPRDVSAS